MEGKQVIDVLFDLVAQVGALRGSIDGLVTHEKQADKMNAVRQEMLLQVGAIEKRLTDLVASTKEDLLESREDRITALEGKMFGKISVEVSAQLENKLADQDKNMKRARAMMLTGGGVGFAVPLVALAQHFMGGGG